MDEPSIKPNKHAIKNDGGNEQHRGIPCRFPDNHPSKDIQRTCKRSIDQDTLIDKC